MPHQSKKWAPLTSFPSNHRNIKTHEKALKLIKSLSIPFPDEKGYCDNLVYARYSVNMNLERCIRRTVITIFLLTRLSITLYRFSKMIVMHYLI